MILASSKVPDPKDKEYEARIGCRKYLRRVTFCTVFLLVRIMCRELTGTNGHDPVTSCDTMLCVSTADIDASKIGRQTTDTDALDFVESQVGHNLQLKSGERDQHTAQDFGQFEKHGRGRPSAILGSGPTYSSPRCHF